MRGGTCLIVWPWAWLDCCGALTCPAQLRKQTRLYQCETSPLKDGFAGSARSLPVSPLSPPWAPSTYDLHLHLQGPSLPTLSSCGSWSPALALKALCPWPLVPGPIIFLEEMPHPHGSLPWDTQPSLPAHASF